jgi:hypothetical protein
MAMVQSHQKDLLRDILPDNSDMPDESLPAAYQAPCKKGKPKKGDPFPKTKSAYLFIVKQIKHGLSIILHQTLDKLQLDLLFQAV